jgi:hypothetical protein
VLERVQGQGQLPKHDPYTWTTAKLYTPPRVTSSNIHKTAWVLKSEILSWDQIWGYKFGPLPKLEPVTTLGTMPKLEPLTTLGTMPKLRTVGRMPNRRTVGMLPKRRTVGRVPKWRTVGRLSKW